MNGPERLLVVGAGQAATDLVGGLLEFGYPGTITVVGAEPHRPYQRPPLSKAHLLVPDHQVGDHREALMLRSAEYFAEHGVDLLLGDPVQQITRGADGVGLARCASGRVLAHDRLVLATGATPREIPELVGVAGVHALRTLDDAERLRPELADGRRLVVLGGGFIGLEVAAAGRERGCQVTVVESADQILGRVVDADVAQHVARCHRARGITIETGRRVEGWQIVDGRIRGLHLDDGRAVPADVVVIGIGATARIALAESLGLHCAQGVLVDAAQRTGDGHTLAIGDCAQGPDRSPGGDPGRHVRWESVDHATQSAAAAVATVLGRPTPRFAPPWFWSDQGAVHIQVVGQHRRDDRAVTRRGEGTDSLLKAYFRDGVLVAATAVNAPGDFMGLRRAITQQVVLTADEIADPTTRLGRLVAQRLRSATTSSVDR